MKIPNFLKGKSSGILFTLLVVNAMPVYSQITITADGMPDVGDTIRLSTTISAGDINYSLTGENYLWDFSTLVPVDQQVDTFVSVASTPFIYRLVFTYSVATIARPEPDVDYIPGYEVTNVFTYFKETEDEFREAGVAFTLSGIPLPVKYDEPDVLYTFPMNFGNIDSCESSVELEFPDLFYFSMVKTRKNTVDGWGTLVTPFGSFDALRLKSEVNEVDSIYIDSLNMGYQIPRNYIQYKWMGNDHGVPLLQIDEEGLLLTVSYIDSLRILTSVNEPSAVSEQVRIFPNPASNLIHVEWEKPIAGKTFLRLCNTAGQELYGKELQPGEPGVIKETISLERLNMTSGSYFIYLISEGYPPVIKKLIYQQP